MCVRVCEERERKRERGTHASSQYSLKIHADLGYSRSRIAVQQIPRHEDSNTAAAKRELKHHAPSSGKTPLISQQKLTIYRQGICLRLNLLLLIYEYPITWIEEKLDALATRYLKRWAGLARPTNPNVLFLSTKERGLNLLSISTLYKSLLVSRQCHLLTS